MQKTSHHSNYCIEEKLSLLLDDYLGGVAIWGAIPAVFDTTSEGFDAGIHVHARNKESRKKIIDKTFRSVDVHHNDKIYSICENAAMSFAMSALFHIDMIELPCTSCGELILDSNMRAIMKNTHHHCQHCHHVTQTPTPCVANPLVALKKELSDAKSIRTVLQPDRHITLNDPKFSGGVQLWGSNAAIVWTAPRIEESGIHVHAYDANGNRVIDNTYSFVEVNGEIIQCEMVQLLQVQLALPEIRQYLSCTTCTHCHQPHFHRGYHAAHPTQIHQCAYCKTQWQTDWIISNPAFHQLNTFNSEGIKQYELYT